METELSFNELDITLPELYEAMGYGTHVPDENVRQLSEQTLSGAAQVTRPCFLYTHIDATLEEETLHSGNCSFAIGRIIARQLRGSERFIIFVATAGVEFEEWTKQLKSEGDIVALYMADSLGSIIAEKTADRMESMLEKELMPQELLHTNRFSPGYCGWHVSEQQKLFSLFPTAEPCGIHLTDSSLMIPIKSVSGVIGIGKQVHKLAYSCGLCTLESCYRRKKRK